MIKDHFLKEINIRSILKKGSKGFEVQKVQEWLNLRRYTDDNWDYTITVDGDFGEQTDKMIRLFQELNNLTVDGEVGPKTFHSLVKPMIQAFSRIDTVGDLRNLIVAYAEQHLKSVPRELYNANRGPWVRAYMDGHEGKQWAWCMGFVQTILDQAFFTLDQSYTLIMPQTYSCDVAGEYGTNHNSLQAYSVIRAHLDLIKPGDVFLINKVPHDWIHTGIITGLDDKMIHTIEGNTNDEGSREGFEVCRRVRNLFTQQIDVYKVIQN